MSTQWTTLSRSTHVWLILIMLLLTASLAFAAPSAYTVTTYPDFDPYSISANGIVCGQVTTLPDESGSFSGKQTHRFA
jgi:hypothetical protein